MVEKSIREFCADVFLYAKGKFCEKHPFDGVLRQFAQNAPLRRMFGSVSRETHGWRLF